MDTARARYLVAYLPDEPVAQQVWAYKQQVADTCGSVRGLRVLPHVTFVRPFLCSVADEQVIIRQLAAFLDTFVPEEICFQGFGHFEGPKSYTIYVAVEQSPLMQEQYAQLSIHARHKLKMPAEQTSTRFTPHMTVAYRDLDRQKFACAWPLFAGKSFQATGQLDRLWLLRHDGARWVPLQEFIFNGRPVTLF